MTHYDVLIIGTGSGNMIVNRRFDGLSVAIAEERRFGGTCLNVGCIPTKMFVRTADLAADAADTSRFGLTTSFTAADWPAIRDRIFTRIDAIESGGRTYRTDEQDNVTVYPEHVSFTGPHSFRSASGAEFTADRVVIAAGSRPQLPEIEGLDRTLVDSPGYPVLTSDTVMRLPALPSSLTVVGGGFIAAELAHVFSSLGVDVTVLVRGPRMLSRADAELSARFTEAFAADHRVHLGTEISRLTRTQSGLHVETTGAEAPAPFDTDLLLLATGRTPNVSGLGLEHAGIDIVSGRVAVDDRLRVLAGGAVLPGVFALGDISSPHQLKHVANHEARVVKANLLADIAAGAPGSADDTALTPVNHHAVPSAVFSRPQVASVGATEEELTAAGVDYVSKVQAYADVAYGWALEDTTGFVKVLADARTRRVLGAHILGPEASMIIQPLIQAMAFDLPADVMAKGQYWIHPALPEAVENALLGLRFEASTDGG